MFNQKFCGILFDSYLQYRYLLNIYKTFYTCEALKYLIDEIIPEQARGQRICLQPRPSRAIRKRRLKRGKGFFALLSKQRTGLQ